MADDAALTLTFELIRSAQGGDDQALNRLLERYYERIRRVVRLRLGRKLRSRVDSGDILQETLLAALGSFDRFEMKDEAAFLNWLAKIAERQVMAAAHHHGAQKRDMDRQAPLVRRQDGETIGIDVAATGMIPADALGEAEQQQMMEDCLHELAEDYRELIILRDYEGMGWSDIAEMTGRPSADAARMMHAKAMIELTVKVKGKVGGAG
jgi:RNA polymerase sigma-70 factor (ECF subfamily)